SRDGPRRGTLVGLPHHADSGSRRGPALRPAHYRSRTGAAAAWAARTSLGLLSPRGLGRAIVVCYLPPPYAAGSRAASPAPAAPLRGRGGAGGDDGPCRRVPGWGGLTTRRH